MFEEIIPDLGIGSKPKEEYFKICSVLEGD
jgi:hypothetical protein